MKNSPHIKISTVLDKIPRSTILLRTEVARVPLHDLSNPSLPIEYKPLYLGFLIKIPQHNTLPRPINFGNCCPQQDSTHKIEQK